MNMIKVYFSICILSTLLLSCGSEEVVQEETEKTVSISIIEDYHENPSDWDVKVNNEWHYFILYKDAIRIIYDYQLESVDLFLDSDSISLDRNDRNVLKSFMYDEYLCFKNNIKNKQINKIKEILK